MAMEYVKNLKTFVLDLIFENSPKIVQSILLKMIVSYLGINDLALSRIMSRISTKGNKCI